MSEITFKVTGFKAVLLLLVLIGFFGFRFLSARSSIETDAAEELVTWLRAAQNLGGDRESGVRIS